MKKLFALCCLLSASFTYSQRGSVGIGTPTPNDGAALEIKSSGKTLLLPRLSTAALNGISTAEAGMTAYDLNKRSMVGYVGSKGASVINQPSFNAFFAVSTGVSYSQSFTASSTFLLQSVSVYLKPETNAVITSFTMTIFSGAGRSGTVLGSTNLVINGSVAGYQDFNLSGSGITIQNGQVYTFSVSINAGAGYSTSASIGSSSTNVYSGGDLYINTTRYASNDLAFDITAEGAGSWQQFLLSSGDQSISGKLSLNGGNADAFTILNGGDTRIWNDNGTANISFYASNVGTGNGNDNATFVIRSNGQTFSFNGTGGSVSSDERLKQDIVPLNNSLQKIMQLNGYSYRFKTKATDPHKEIGVLAQEVKKVVPDAVYTDDKGMYSVSYNALVPLLINAVKEQQAEIEKLKSNDTKALSLQKENDTLKQKQQDLTKRMEQLEALVMKQQNSSEIISRK